MSHSVVLVVLPQPPSSKADVEEQLAQLLAPFDENMQVDRYKDRVSVAPPDWRERPWIELSWPVSSLLEKDPRPEDKALFDAWRSRPAGEFHAECELSDPAAVVAAVTAKWPPEDDPDDSYFLDEEGVYRWSTYNPQSKWDWWLLGGRWTGELMPKADYTGLRISGEPGLMTDRAAPGMCDALPLNALDMDGMRAIRAVEARERWAQAQADEPDRREFRWGVRPTDTEESYVERRSANPLSSWAVLAEGVWRERGRMGWFGMSDATPESEQDFDQWLARFLIASAESPVWIALVDVHI